MENLEFFRLESLPIFLKAWLVTGWYDKKWNPSMAHIKLDYHNLG